MKRYYRPLGILCFVFAIVSSLAIAFGKAADVPRNPFAEHEAFMPGASIMVAARLPGCRMEAPMMYEHLQFVTCRDVSGFRWIFTSSQDVNIHYTSFYPSGNIPVGWLWQWFEDCHELRTNKWSRLVQCADGVEAGVVIRRRFRWNPYSKYSTVMVVRFSEAE